MILSLGYLYETHVMFCLYYFVCCSKIHSNIDTAADIRRMFFAGLTSHLFIFQLKFEDDLRISNMYSAEGEMVQFSEKLYPTGNVEDWLLEVENTMRSSLREILYQALQEYGDVSIAYGLRCSSVKLFLTLFGV